MRSLCHGPIFFFTTSDHCVLWRFVSCVLVTFDVHLAPSMYGDHRKADSVNFILGSDLILFNLNRALISSYWRNGYILIRLLRCSGKKNLTVIWKKLWISEIHLQAWVKGRVWLARLFPLSKGKMLFFNLDSTQILSHQIFFSI